MSDRKVYTLFNHGKKPATPSGDRYLNVYQEEFDKKTGEKKITCTGKTCVWDMIQADLEQSKIENILHSVAMGDLSVLNQRQGFYVDATEFPHSLMEAENLVIDIQNKFHEMPDDFKEIFNNSPEEYVRELGEGTYNDKVKEYFAKKQETTTAAATAEYNNKVAAEAKFQNDVAAAKGGNE